MSVSSTTAFSIESQLDTTASEADSSLEQLSTGLRINSGADDAAGLSIANGLNADVAALNQSTQNISDGIGMLQTTDGALSQITDLLQRGITLATQASTSTLTQAQMQATDGEFQSVLNEINNIAASTTYNGQPVFQLSLGVSDRYVDSGSLIDPGATIYGTAQTNLAPYAFFMSDGSASGSTSVIYQPLSVDARALGLEQNHSSTVTGQNLVFGSNMVITSTSGAQTALTALNGAITQISADRGTVGGTIEQLQAASSVLTSESQSLQTAASDITSADIGQTVANDAKYSVLEQTGVSALGQANQELQNVLKLIHS